MAIWPLGHVRPIKVEKITHMGRKGPRAKTKIVLKSVSKVEQLGSMPNLKFQTFLNKNPPSVTEEKKKTRNFFAEFFKVKG